MVNLFGFGGLAPEKLNNSTPATEFGLGTAGKIRICTSKPNIQSQTWPLSVRAIGPVTDPY